MKKDRLLGKINTLGLMCLIVSLLLVSLTKVKADSLQVIKHEGIKLSINERVVGYEIELDIQADSNESLELDSITYKEDTYFFNGNRVKMKISIEEIEHIKLNYTRNLSLNSNSIARKESYLFQTNLMQKQLVDLETIEKISDDIEVPVKILDSIPNLNELDSIIGHDEYININQEKDQIEVLKYDPSLKGNEKLGMQVKTGSKISSGVNFHWGANASFAWQFPGGFSEISVNDIIAYCLEPSILQTETNQATSIRLRDVSRIRVMDGRLYTTLSRSQIERIELIASYGYQFPGHNTKTYRWATQVMVFETIGWVFDSLGTPSIKSEITEIERLITLHSKKPTWNGQTITCVSGDIVDLSDAALEGYVVDTEKSKSIEIVSFNGKELKVKPLNDNAVLELSKIAAASVGDSAVYSDGASQKVGTIKLPSDLRLNVRFKLKPGSVNVTKSDTDGLKYAGVQFEISKNKNDIIGTITTDSKGFASLENLVAGIYFIREKYVPSPLVIDANWYQFIVESDKKTEYNAVNAKVVGEIQVFKTDDLGNPVPRVTFELRDSSDKLINTLITNKDGKLVFKSLELGTYALIETSVDAPFVIEANPLNIELKYVDFETPVIRESVQIINHRAKGKISIQKISSDGSFIEGAVFEIRDDNGDYVGNLVTQQDGTAISEELDLGKYRVKESYVPKPYVLDSKEHEVALIYQNQNTEIVVETLSVVNYPQTVELKVIKVEDSTDPIFVNNHGKTISGTEFGLFLINDNNEVLVEKGISDSNGELVFKNLSLGKYMLRELSPSPGYEFSEFVNCFDFTYDHLHPDQPIIFEKLIVENTPLLGDAKLIKENDKGMRLEGAVYDLFTVDNRFISQHITNPEGIIKTPMLRFGKYYLQETQAPVGHELTHEKIYFTINSSTQTLNLNAINPVHKANLRIKKVDLLTNKPLAGAHFKIKNIDTGKFYSHVDIIENRAVVKDEWVSDVNGMITLVEPLIYGNYRLIETKAPAGYQLGEHLDFSIDENQIYDYDELGRILMIEYTNVQEVYSIEVVKTDEKSKCSIEGVRFALFSKEKSGLEALESSIVRSYDDNGNLVKNSFVDGIKPEAIGVSDKNGILSFSGLSLNDYYIVEMNAPYGYTINQNIVVVNQGDLLLKSEKNKFRLNLKNKRSKVKLVVSKKDSFSYDKLVGKDYILELYNSENLKVKHSIFDDGDHVWFVDALESYYLIEAKAPKGYKLSNETVHIDTSINTNGIYEVDFLNDVMYEEVLPYTGKSNINALAYILLGIGLLFVYYEYRNRLKND